MMSIDIFDITGFQAELFNMSNVEVFTVLQLGNNLSKKNIFQKKISKRSKTILFMLMILSGALGDF